MNGARPVRRAVGAIIYCGGRGHILVAQRVRDEKGPLAKPEWDIPKGGVNDGEDDEAALRRELREELGLTEFKAIRKLGFGISFAFTGRLAEKYSSQQTALFEIECENCGINPQNDEIGAIEVVTFDEALARIGFEETREALRKARDCSN